MSLESILRFDKYYMRDLGTLTQQVVRDALSSNGDTAAKLQALQSPLKDIRNAYRRGHPPLFSSKRVRAAYALCYFPHHAALAAAAYGAAGLKMLSLRDGATVVVLGAGPGPEVVGLAQYLLGLGRCMSLNIHLVDREAGWRVTRAVTIDAVLERLEGFDRSCFRIHTHEHDLGTVEGVGETAALIGKANLVVAETLLTELPTPSKDGHLVDWLIDRLSGDGRLLLIDFDRVKRYGSSLDRLEYASHLECRLRSNLEFPAAKTLPQIEKNLFSADEHPRRRLNVSIALYSRHGCAEPSFVDSVPFEFNDSQVQALEKMRTFLQGPERVFVLTGAAGTGKTALFPAIVGLVQESGHCVQLMAPTGQASRRLAKIASLGASTVHATIYIDATHLTTSGNEQSSELTGNIEQFALTPSLVEDADESPPVSVFELREPPSVPVVYIIDEASLIGNRQVERQGSEVVFADGMLLSDLIKFTLSHPDSRVIFVGDPWQLPPIGEQFSPALECDELERITGCLPAFATLTQVMRQDERSAVLDLADRASIATIHGGFDTGPDDPEAGINLLGSDLLPGWVNSALIRGEAVVIAARNADVARWNKSIRKAADLPLDKLNQGDLVSVLRRDSQRNIQNGDDLIVESLTDQIVPITVKGETVTLREAVFRFDMHGVGPVLFNALFVEDLLYQASADDKQRITRLLFIDFRMRHKDLKPNTESFNLAYDADARVNALRVCYSYARTCHRAQGGEWPQVVVDFTGSRWLGPSFGRWAYTAVTRPKRSIWLASIPSTGAPLGADALADGAKLVLQAIGFDNVTLRPIQYGVQLKISRAGSTLGVNLYEKKGRPSSVEVTGSSAPAFTDDVVQALKGWVIDMNIKAMDPLPEKLEEIYVVLGSEFQEAGYDLLIQPYAAYQAKFILKDAVSREASAICSYKGNGFLSYIQMLEGDLALQQKLREALECVIA